MATTLGAISPGQLVTLNESGSPVQFYVACQDYESGLNGAGRTLLVRKDVYQNGQWNSANVNAYAGSTIDDWFNNNYLQLLDPGIQVAAGTTTFYYTPGNRNNTVGTLERSIFAMSLTELGESNAYANAEGSALPINNTLQIISSSQWTRSPNIGTNPVSSWYLNSNGDVNFGYCTVTYGYRPCLTLPSTMTVNDDNSVQPQPIPLGDAPVGSVVKINESGSPVNYIVVNQGIPGNSPLYDSSCDGTWVLRQDLKDRGPWGDTVDFNSQSSIMTTMEGYLSLFDAGIQAAINIVKIPYANSADGSTISGANGLECRIFPLGGLETGFIVGENGYIDGAKLDFFEAGAGSSAMSKRVSKWNGVNHNWYTRYPVVTTPNEKWMVQNDGSYSTVNISSNVGYRPAFILPQNLTVLPDGTLQAAPSFNTLPIQVMEGQSLLVSWSAMDGATAYTLQRQVDGGGWTQVYSGADTTYTDTVPAGTTLQYQVQATIDGAAGAFGQSGVIAVISASALAISGEDGNLGIVTNDIQYAVNTDTGNQISLTRTVNGNLVASLDVDDGFAYDIPVMDLPTGTGTIVITATVQTSSDPVTVTRTWTYTKQAQTFPTSGGLTQLSQDGQNVFPLTLAEAVKAIGGPWGGNLSTALDKLATAATYTATAVPKYTAVTVDLSTAQAGDVVNLPENGVMVPFYVASLDYEPTLNTSGTRVLLVRKDVYQKGQWNATNVNTYAGSTIDTWFNSTYLPMLDSAVRAQVGTTTFYYTPGNGSNEVTTLARAVFALSMTEFGLSADYVNTEGTPIPTSNLFNKGSIQWTRTPPTSSVFQAEVIDAGGGFFTNACNSSNAYRPCFTLPATFQATYYVDPNSGTVYPAQEYTTAGDFADLWGNIIPTVKIETGSYVGTGTYGADNPNTLTFSFDPKAVWVARAAGWSSGNAIGNVIPFSPENNITCAVISSISTVPFISLVTSITGNTLSFYSSGNNADYQLNSSGTTYFYIAFG